METNRNYSPIDIGKEGEQIVRDWLQRQAFMVLPANLIRNGGAPMLTGEEIKAILPDNLTWKEGTPGWVEVKTYSYPSLHIKTPRRWEHAILSRHFESYKLIQEITSIEVSLAILELSNKLLLIGRLKELERHMFTRLMARKWHCFFLRSDRELNSDFYQWNDVSSLALPFPITPKAQRTITQGPSPNAKQFSLFQ